MSRKIFSWKAAFAVGVMALVAILSAAHVRAEGCSVKDIKGVYIGTFSGFIVGGPFAGPYASLARIVCDGKGNCAGSGTQSLNGTVFPLVDTGSDPYTVNPDCTGTITVNAVGGPPLHFNVLSLKDGKEAWSIQTDPGTVISGHLQLLSRDE